MKHSDELNVSIFRELTHFVVNMSIHIKCNWLAVEMLSSLTQFIALITNLMLTH